MARVLRTDNSFRNRTHVNHHKSLELSPFEYLNVGMVTQVPIDSMHAIDIGIGKKICTLLKDKKIKGAPTLNSELAELDNVHSLYKKFTPSEFQRKPKPLVSRLPDWKATDFRQLLLYTGIVLFKKFFTPELYDHFLKLSIALRILNKNITEANLNTATTLLDSFVEDFDNFYPLKERGWNVHALLHIPADCRKFGVLNNFSAYPFENEMRHLSTLIRSKNKVLEQVRNRLWERRKFGCELRLNAMKDDNFIICVGNKDSCFILRDKTVIQLIEWDDTLKNGVGIVYKIDGDIFDTPLKSSQLNIYVCSPTKKRRKIERGTLLIKCTSCRTETNFWFFPLSMGIKTTK